MIKWEFGSHKYYRTNLSDEEKKDIQGITCINFFKNQGPIKWLSIYLYEDGEYVVSLDQLGEAYYESSPDNDRFGKGFQVRLEDPNHVIHFIENNILIDKFFLT